MRDQRTSGIFIVMAVGAALGAGCLAADFVDDEAVAPGPEPATVLGSGPGREAAPRVTSIVPPASALERPARVHVLPVIWIAADASTAAEQLAMAQNNLTVHLRVARKKYELMLMSRA